MTEPQTAAAGNEIRPEVKEFLDAYEACMDEYVDFMQKYMNADPSSMVPMMGTTTASSPATPSLRRKSTLSTRAS